MAFIFLRTIVKGLELGLNLIYLDEVGFKLENANFYIWRKNGELFYGVAKSNSKIKLDVFLAVDENQILYGKFLNIKILKVVTLFNIWMNC